MLPIRFASVVLALVLSSVASAQEKPPEPKPDAAAPASPSASDPAELLRQMESMYPRALQGVPALAPGADEKARAEHARRLDDRRALVDSFAKAGDDYMTALHGAGPDARALYFHGVAKELAAKIAPSSDLARRSHIAAAESLQRYLDAADEKSAFRTDAEMYLGQALLFSSKDDAIVHLRRAVELLQEDGRHDEAGVCAADAMMSLASLSRTAELNEFATAIHAADADFGNSTGTIRKYVAQAKLNVGSQLPELPSVKDVDGQPISFATADGKPLLFHFFLAGYLDGRPTAFREIELDLRPIWEQYREKGLRVVGVSMDNEWPKAAADAKRKQWDEWGKKPEDFRDGSLETVRAWTKKQGIEWPWYWDGKATNNPLSLALGKDVGVTEPYAVLVDKDGIVRWHGKAPFTGLADEVAKVVK